MRSRNGYILAELATAVFIISVLMAVTGSFIFMCSDQMGASHDFLIARQIASNKLEMMRSLPFDELRPTDGDGDDFTSPLSAELNGFVAMVHVEPFDGNAALKKITVTVRWSEKRRTRELSLSVLKGDRTP
jgi:hypothetical protein